MWGSRGRGTEVTCIACGSTVERSDAREYDKHGDRFDRADKEFEFLCKPCYRDISHQPRGDLEDVLEESWPASHRSGLIGRCIVSFDEHVVWTLEILRPVVSRRRPHSRSTVGSGRSSRSSS